uniref:Uncharacterized protein n=1 Tax=Arundo donax TaxID=35708 RepID=A0A0A9AM79_ARUDO
MTPLKKSFTKANSSGLFDATLVCLARFTFCFLMPEPLSEAYLL